MSDRKAIPIGIDNFEDIIMQEFYYVDKSLLLKKLLDSKASTTLFTRPRRFGKSLNLSMIKHFFEINYELKLSEIKERMRVGYDEYTDTKLKESGAKYLAENPNNSKFAHLFKDLKIMFAGEKYLSHMGKYPVIMLNFKSGKQMDFESSYYKLRENIAKEFERHVQILETGILNEREVKEYQEILNKADDMNLFSSSVKFLSSCLEKVYGQKSIILIDEYDVPLENAYFNNFYNEMIGFIRGLLEHALKTNTSLAFSVLTGCLRITKESIFTGLNHLMIVSINTVGYGEYYGFTNKEVEEMLKYYDKSHHMDIIREWYDGYVFGNEEVYNPWSVLNYLKNALEYDNALPLPYWAHTSSNSIIRNLAETRDNEVKEEIETLIQGGTIKKVIYEDITYEGAFKSSNNLWNFLFFTGYLKKIDEEADDFSGEIYYTLKIPNKELALIYKRHIREWFEETTKQKDLTALYDATLSGDVETMRSEIKKMLLSSISYFDNIEAFYHGFIAGIYNPLNNYKVLSNKESGEGRPDLALIPLDHEETAIIFELKTAKNYGEIEQKADEAVEQIIKNKYVEGIHAEYYKKVVAYGIGFCKKNCVIRKL